MAKPGFYDTHIVPRLINLVMRHPMAAVERPGVVAGVRGVVLEMGIGSGFNLEHYPKQATRVLAVEPSDYLREKSARRARELGMELEFAGHDGAEIQLPDASVDSIVMTWALCTIPDPAGAIAEMYRVLRPGGRLHFIEHGAADDARIHAWQNRLNPAWRCLAGGCNINRHPDEIIAAGGFSFERLEKSFADGPKLLSFEYKGVAHKD